MHLCVCSACIEDLEKSLQNTFQIFCDSGICLSNQKSLDYAQYLINVAATSEI